MNSDDSVARKGVDPVNPWTLTASGQKLYYLNPTPDSLLLEDIAHSLGNICRFTGATSQFYSVAQHSLHVGQLVKRMLDDEGVDRNHEYWDQILAALLHDCEEAYVNDLASPLKSVIRGKYQWIANSLRYAVFDKYDIDREYHNTIVKCADNIAVIIERYHFMPVHRDWPGASTAEIAEYDKPPYRGPSEASQEFLDAVRYALIQRDSLKPSAPPEAL